MKLFCRLILVLAPLTLACDLSVAGPDKGLLNNPPPSAAFNGYGKYELKPLIVVAPYASQPANQKAAAKIREHIGEQMEPIVAAWNKSGGTSGKTGTLVIEPIVEEIKFIGGGARFWAGAMAGSSYVILRLKVSEAETGTVIAQPEFFQRAQAVSGAWSFGGADNGMLGRIVTVASAYLNGNYETAAGGATGREL
ncbi:MAG TPA: hypothetical protein VE046_14900 [Steroidobacteraceae bacterium]|nr:hypothetical protein [Steroidobacteraceae bacterium]